MKVPGEVMTTVRLDVRRIGSDKVLHSVDVRGRGEQAIERVMLGMLANMHDECYIVEVEEPNE